MTDKTPFPADDLFKAPAAGVAVPESPLGDRGTEAMRKLRDPFAVDAQPAGAHRPA